MSAPLRNAADAVLLIFFGTMLAAWYGPISTSATAQDTAGSTNRMELALLGGGAIELVWVPGGRFNMGSDKGDEDEQPVHRITLRRGYWVGRYEVTQQQYELVTGQNPSTFKHPDHPVEFVSHQELTAFFENLPKRSTMPDDLTARLPTEAEWEYACRAGGSGTVPDVPSSEELNDVAWFAPNSMGSTHPVGQKKPNAFGLYDMLGNVSEWCEDWYLERFYKVTTQETDPKGSFAGSSKVIRGGSWRNSAPYCRPANRFQFRVFSKDYTVGFRIVLVAK